MTDDRRLHRQRTSSEVDRARDHERERDSDRDHERRRERDQRSRQQRHQHQSSQHQQPDGRRRDHGREDSRYQSQESGESRALGQDDQRRHSEQRHSLRRNGSSSSSSSSSSRSSSKVNMPGSTQASAAGAFDVKESKKDGSSSSKSQTQSSSSSSHAREKQSQSKAGSEFLFRFRYRNVIPPPPFDPKSIKYFIDDEKLYGYRYSSIERHWAYTLPVPSMPLDLAALGVFDDEPKGSPASSSQSEAKMQSNVLDDELSCLGVHGASTPVDLDASLLDPRDAALLASLSQLSLGVSSRRQSKDQKTASAAEFGASTPGRKNEFSPSAKSLTVSSTGYTNSSHQQNAASISRKLAADMVLRPSKGLSTPPPPHLASSRANAKVSQRPMPTAPAKKPSSLPREDPYSFSAFNNAVADLSKLRHPTKPTLKAQRVFPIVPNLARWCTRRAHVTMGDNQVPSDSLLAFSGKSQTGVSEFCNLYSSVVIPSNTIGEKRHSTDLRKVKPQPPNENGEEAMYLLREYACRAGTMSNIQKATQINNESAYPRKILLTIDRDRGCAFYVPVHERMHLSKYNVSTSGSKRLRMEREKPDDAETSDEEFDKEEVTKPSFLLRRVPPPEIQSALDEGVLRRLHVPSSIIDAVLQSTDPHSWCQVLTPTMETKATDDAKATATEQSA